MMTRRILTLMLALCLMLPATALAEVSACVQQTTEVVTGPGEGYWWPEINIWAGTQAKALSRTWDDYYGVWQILVEFRWENDWHRGYVVARRLSTDVARIPIEEPLQWCYLVTDADAFAGPGITYTLWNDTVYRGTDALLLAVEDGWGFIECWNAAKRASWRVWVPLQKLSCADAYRQSSSTQPSTYSYLPEVPYGGIRAGCGNAKSIMWVQQCLRSCGYGELAVDGKWGPQTSGAVRQFRIDHGYGAGETVTYAMACEMLDMFVSRGMPLSYLRHYLPD